MLTADDRRRYSRNIMLAGIGKEGQERLIASRVLIVGCGALGSIAAMYLCGSGVGHLTIVDFDTVDISNLQRQLSFTMSSLGKKKVEQTAQRLHEINPGVEVDALDMLLTRSNAREIIERQDLVIEGSDNPATKHLIAATCEACGKPYIMGGVAGWEGQVLTCLPGSAGYTDLFPEPAADGGFTPCSLGGVLGPLPGIIASMQAAEAIKVITGAGKPLASRLMLIDMLTAEVRTVAL